MKAGLRRRYRRVVASLIYILARTPSGNFNSIVEDWIRGMEPYLPQKDVQRIRDLVVNFKERGTKTGSIIQSMMKFNL